MYATKPQFRSLWAFTGNSVISCTRKEFIYASSAAVHVPAYAEATIDSAVAKCSSMSQIKTLHAQIILQGLSGDIISLSRLILLCAMSSFGDKEYADYLFDRIPTPNRYIYNTLIRASVNDGKPSRAVFLYRKMVNSGIYPNEFTFPFIFKACAYLRTLLEGISVHLHAVKLGFSDCHISVQNGLINFYVGCGKIETAIEIFNLMDFKTLVTWNSMISGYAKFGKCCKAFLLFLDMRNDGVEPDGHTFVSLLSVCSQINNIEFGKSLHWYIEINGVLSDVHLQNALLDMYAKCGHFQIAEAIFARTVNKSVVSWTSMITAYAKHGLVELAESTFKQMPVKNVISWNSMITCYLQNGLYTKSLEFFDRMNSSSSLVPDQTTIASVLSACSQLGDFSTGKKLHDYIRENAIKLTITSSNALIDMYAKCGYMETAFDIFLSMPEKNIVSWNTMINALAFHGSGHKAVDLFQKMLANGIQPDAVTFSGLLSACCHCGLIETGQLLFHSMKNSFKIPYEIHHYACMIDILGRAGLFKEALKLIVEMPMKPDTVIWGALLSGCKMHRNVRIAKLILKQLLETKLYSGGLYTLLSNIFYESQHRYEMKSIWILMDCCCYRRIKGLVLLKLVVDFMIL